MLSGFAHRMVDVGETTVALSMSGDGPPLLLLHGYPQTRSCWHRIAPALARRFTVVAPDLRGYGQSSKPPGGEDHTAYSKRAMASDVVAAMAALGFPRFAVAGHDRGGRVVHRMALDHPAAWSARRCSTSSPPAPCSRPDQALPRPTTTGSSSSSRRPSPR